MAAPDPQFARAVQLLQSGQLQLAAQQIEALLKTRPGDFEARHLSGIIAFQSGDRKLAVGRLEQALKDRPDHAQLLSDLGMMCHAIGDYQPASQYLAKALALAPQSAAAHLNMGNVMMDTGRQLRAEHHLREALRLQPRFGAALNNLSRLLLSLGRAAEAADFARQLIALAPASAAGHSRLGAALDRLGQLDAAITAHKKALALSPNDNATRLSYASSLAGYGRMQDAIAECRQAIKINPRDATAFAQLTSLIELSAEPETERQMTGLMKDQNLSAQARGTLGFALGRAREQNKLYRQAFDLIQTANALFSEQVRYDPHTASAMAKDIIRAFTPDTIGNFKGAGSPDSTPVFIVGMPRSGTTLTEQILCASPGTVGAGEPAILRTLADRTSEAVKATSLEAMMAAIHPKTLTALGEDYVRLLRPYGPEATHIIDKVPSNFLFVGLIRLCLPHAKIIHCQRNPADTCLSIYKNRFAAGNQLFAYDLDHLAQYYAAYLKIMTHWDKLLPGKVHTVRYEEMVADQMGQSQALYAHCGLEWTGMAMEFFKTERPVHTASIAQVRRPIYGGSSGIAARYGDAAKPLFDALERAGIAIA